MPRTIYSLAYVMLCTLLLSGVASAANIDLSLNLEFNDPSDFGSGGDWTIVAKAEQRGIAGIVLYLQDPTLNFDPVTGFLAPAEFEIALSQTDGLVLEIVQGDDLIDPTLDIGVIGGTFPSTYVDDPGLIPFGANPDLGSFSGGVALVEGTFDPGDVPAWANDALGNIFPYAVSPVVSATVLTTVRYVVPEPATLLLFGLGLTLTVAMRRRG